MRYRSLNLFGLKVSFRNFSEAAIIFRDIFLYRDYYFKSDNKSPLILDCGAHIGISVIYFKRLYPNSRIIAFEPDPVNFELLTLNVKQNNLKKVMLVNSALSDREGNLDLFTSTEKKSPWTWGASLEIKKWPGEKTKKAVKVRTEKLSKYIKGRVELVKLDIEGAETKVINEIENKLQYVEKIVLEFHGLKSQKGNDLEKIVNLLQEHGFVCSFKQYGWGLPYGKIDRKDPFWLMVNCCKIDQ